MTLEYFSDYSELFEGCVAYYDGSYSGTTLYNILNPAQNATMGANVSIVEDRFGKTKAIQTNPSSSTDSTAVVTCYPQSGSLYAACFWVNVRTANASGEINCIAVASNIQLVVGDFSGFFDPVVAIGQSNSPYYITYNAESLSIGWHFIMFKWNGSKYDIYIDNIFKSTSAYGAGNSPLIAITMNKIGYWSSSNKYFMTVISDYMVFTSQPTIEQMLAIYKLQRNKYLYPVQAGMRNVE